MHIHKVGDLMPRTHVWMEVCSACPAIACVNVTNSYISQTYTCQHAKRPRVMIDDVITWVIEILRTHEACKCHKLLHVTNSHMSTRRAAAGDDRRSQNMSHGNTMNLWQVHVTNSIISTHRGAAGDDRWCRWHESWKYHELMRHVDVTNSYILTHRGAAGDDRWCRWHCYCATRLRYVVAVCCSALLQCVQVPYCSALLQYVAVTLLLR